MPDLVISVNEPTYCEITTLAPRLAIKPHYRESQERALTAVASRVLGFLVWKTSTRKFIQKI
jgi:hypothetical protein